jgi:cytochrome c-type biogenesis protein CcmF
MASLGYACLLLTLALCGYGIVAALYGARAHLGANAAASWVESARRAVYALALVLTVAIAVLEVAFLRNDFAFYTVATSSSRTTPEIYRAAAIWASQEGSLLLWSWLLAIWSSLMLFFARRHMREATPYAIAILLGLAGFFDALMVFYANPFRLLNPAPAEGAGLDPLLRFPTMMIHPPMLYSGYTLSMVPLAFCAGALIARRVDAQWIRLTRRFALASWMFLGFGILLGARWSFSELGWGGYWGWDPVENAALMPWLTGTAFIHSIMIQEKRGMLKVWNAALVLATGTLAIMGTFLVRSGVLNSIHAFGASTLGVPFVVLIALMIGGSIYLVVSRRELLRSEHRLDSLFSRESAFLANNLVLVGLCFVVFWGTYFPLISKAVNGQQASVGGPWFDRYTVPLALVLVALTGIGPIIPWRRASLGALRRHALGPLIVAGLVLVALLAAGVRSHPSALAMFTLGAFVLAVVLAELARGTRARIAITREAPPAALLALIGRNRRRYGGYLVHAGIAVLLIGIAGSSSFEHQVERGLAVGQSVKVGGDVVRYVRPTAALLNGPDHTGATLNLGAILEVRSHGRRISLLHPSEGFYSSDEPSQGSVGYLIGGQPVSHVAMDSGLSGDVWSAIEPNIHTPALQRVIEAANRIVPAGHVEEALVALTVLARDYLRDPPTAEFNLISLPLVEWLWLGGILALIGALIALWPGPRPLHALAKASGLAARRGRGAATEPLGA